jgi:NAD(P)-dependent dehydrogenase (short-subunit alcohol dehydrogenase family)
MVAHGWRVFGTARRDEDLAALSASGVEPVPLELNDSESVAGCMAHVLAKTGGRLDLLVNNAATGVLGRLEGDKSLDRASMERDFGANVIGTVELSLAAAQAMVGGGKGGRIVFISSVLGLHPVPGKSVYAASKAALNSFAESFAMELSPNIRVANLILGPLSPDGEKSFGACSHKTAWGKLLRACEANRPRTTYHAGLPAHGLAWLLRLAPRALVRRILRRAQP